MADPDLLAARLQVSTLQAGPDRAHQQVSDRDRAIEALNLRLRTATGECTRARHELEDLRREVETRRQQSARDRQRNAQARYGPVSGLETAQTGADISRPIPRP